MLNENLSLKLNEQMNYEFYSSHIYLAMAAFCSAESLEGFANFFIVQAEEERFHAMKIYHFLNARGKRAMISGMEEPNNEYESVMQAFKHAYSHEQIVTERLYKLFQDLAMNEREHATINFLKWFIDEQVEEEAAFDNIIQKLRRIENDSNAFFMLDTEFSKRTFSPPVEL